ncbi:hypothetical protein [Sulfurisoma sediminicola]|nr:hypothetical protein [Sulfurisoma sediminicola]
MANANGRADRGVAGFSLLRVGKALILFFAVLIGFIFFATTSGPDASGKPAATTPAAAAVTPDPAHRQREAEAQRLRATEVAECPDGEMATQTAHGNVPVNALAVAGRFNSLRFAYNPALAPESVPEARLAGIISAAAQAWSACGIRGEFVGTTQDMSGAANTFVVQWYNSEGVPIAGYRKGTTIYLNAGHYQTMRAHSEVYAQDVMQRLISHEMGHAFGLVEHSARCVDVMATEDSFDKCDRDPAAPRTIRDTDKLFFVKQQAFPTACDIKRCRLINGLAAPAPGA